MFPVQYRLLTLALVLSLAPWTNGQKKSGTVKPAGTAGNAALIEKPGEGASGKKSTEDAGETNADGPKKDQTVYSYGLPSPDGHNASLADYKGKVLLIVNLARESDYAAQLPALQKLSDTFKDKGLVVIGVPSNDFGNAEPGSPTDVTRFYTDAKVTFPIMQLSTLTGVHELPLFSFLTKSKGVENNGLHWNYTKFLVDRKGKLIVCFPPEVAPDSLEMMATVEEALDGTWKPKKPKRPAPSEAEDDGL